MSDTTDKLRAVAERMLNAEVNDHEAIVEYIKQFYAEVTLAMLNVIEAATEERDSRAPEVVCCDDCVPWDDLWVELNYSLERLEQTINGDLDVNEDL